jgi:hypothetical protein
MAKDRIEAEDKNQEAYFKAVFGKENPCRRKVEAALDRAHEIRQFEIRLYWQRSLFFWGFILTFFTAFTLIYRTEDKDIKMSDHEIETIVFLFILSLLGFFTSFAWRYVEVGSKTWMSNWEQHIDFLEAPITGHLYKSVIGDDDKFYSLSSIHRTFIPVIMLVWVGLNLFVSNYLPCGNYIFPILILAYAILFLLRKKLTNRWKTSERTIPKNNHTESTESTSYSLLQRGYREFKFSRLMIRRPPND